MNRKKASTVCPISNAVSHLGDRWSLLIIRDMMFMGKQNYTEFLESPEGISTKILAQRLRALEDEAIISKHRDLDNQSKNIYRLTEKGIDLMPIIVEMAIWSTTHVNGVDIEAGHMNAIRQDKAGFLKMAMGRLKDQLKTSQEVRA